MNQLLNNINSPDDLKKLSVNQLPQLAQELRQFLVQTVLETGGHLASNLGVVELTIAMMYVYDFPQDKLVWDVGHQSYIYKILTGRRDRMHTIRTLGGLSGFPDRNESRYDVFNTGHATTSISAALGIARANELNHSDKPTLAIIGDGALTGGMAWEALNELGETNLPVMIVFNDNKMSIDHNVGSVSTRLSKVRISKGYMRFKSRIQRIVRKSPCVYRFLKRIRDNVKLRFIQNKLFEQLGIKYIGPIDGHDVKGLVGYFKSLREYKKPVLVHVITKKGKGYADAENDPTAYHGLSPKNAIKYPSFSLAMGTCLTQLAQSNQNIVAVTAAMTYGTGLTEFATKHPNRLFDVGIAEAHAVTMAAGLALSGYHPFVAIYSTFLQRAYDQILHDVCLQDLPVTFCLDRAGISNGDGATHHGLYDIGYLQTMPNMTIYAPKNIDDLKQALIFAATYNHPMAIRYPKDCVYKNNAEAQLRKVSAFEYGAWEELKTLSPVTVVAYGDRMLALAQEALNGTNVGLVNAAFIQPLDEEMLAKLSKCRRIIVLEDALSQCGLFSLLANYFVQRGTGELKLVSMGVPNTIVPFGDSNRIFEQYKITAEELRALIVEESENI